MKAEDEAAGAAGHGNGASAPSRTDSPTAALPGAGGSSGIESGNNALPVGFQLAEFRIERVIGEGGFGIVYLAHDTQLDRPVAVKEYMPAALASRTASLAISVKSERYRETFDAGLRSFVNEARLLAQFDHPALVKVYRFWEERGTAYMVMPFYEGPTLKEWRRVQSAPPPEEWVRALLAALFDAIELLHSRNCFHRDIAPDNILLLEDERGLRPLLLDFGAARRIIGDMTQALTVILKPGYAPVEQYAEIPSMRQGPWTDIYALSAVLYFVAVGRAPPASVGRMMADDFTPAQQLAAGIYSAGLLAAIDAGLGVKPESRPQSIAEFRRMVFGAGPGVVPASDSSGAGAAIDDRTIIVARPPAQTSGGLDSRSAAKPLAGTLPTGVSTQQIAPAEPVSRPGGTSRRIWVAAAGAGVLMVGAIAAWLMARQPDAPTKSASSVAGTAAEAQFATSPPSLLLRRLLESRDPSIQVDVRPAARGLAIGRDMLSFSVRSSAAGYVYVLFAGTDDKHMALLFPNERDKDNRIAGGGDLRLPRESWVVTAEGPPGMNRVLVLVSPWPRDFSAAGLGSGEIFSEFSLDAVRAAIAGRGLPALAGVAQCPVAEPNCNGNFGAALFEIEEYEVAKNRGS